MGTRLGAAERARLARGLAAVCGAAGLDPGGAELIKFTMNAVFRLDQAGVVVRLTADDSAAARDSAAGRDSAVGRVERVVRVAGALIALGAPVAPLAPGFERVVRADGWCASIWTLLPQPTGRRWEPIDLAAPLRAIHAVDPAGLDLPRWDPVAKCRGRIARVADATDDALHRWAVSAVGAPLDAIVARLDRWCGDLAVAIGRVAWTPPVVIHGDAHTGNLLVGPGGRTVLCDLDSVALGPREWDLTPAAHGTVRFGRPPEGYAALAAAYGFDVTDRPTWATLRQLRELQLVTSVLATVTGRPAVADELARRLRSVLAGDDSAIWRRYD